jgi:endoglucanase
MKNKIYVNQIGYSLYGIKKAVYTDSAGSFHDSFSLVDAVSDKTMMTGKLTPEQYDENAGDTVSAADFTSFALPGEYYIRVGNVRSFTFVIAERPYTNLKKMLLKGFYYNRCGKTEKSYVGKYAHIKCHAAPATLIEDNTKSIDVSGGWHHSGSYNKYTGAGCAAAANMLYAYKMFPSAFGERGNIPDSPHDMPDILAECRTELRWLLKMQNSDGGVYRKVSTVSYSAYVLPEDDTEEMYVSPCSLQTTLMFVAVMALAAGVYNDCDKDFSDILYAAAVNGWEWICSHPNGGNRNSFTVVTHLSEEDKPAESTDELMFWAACELYELTGESIFEEKIDALCSHVKITSFTSHNPGGFGAISYMTGSRPRKIETERNIRLRYRIYADELVLMAEKSGYGLGAERSDYDVFTNLKIMDKAAALVFADIILKCHDYISTAEEHFSYILGKNPLNKCFVTGIGSNPVVSPHHRMSAFGGCENPVPGLVVYGSCFSENYKDDYAKWNIPRGTSPQKCYCDSNLCFSTNESSICSNSALLFLAAYFDTK